MCDPPRFERLKRCWHVQLNAGATLALLGAIGSIPSPAQEGLGRHLTRNSKPSPASRAPIANDCADCGLEH
eukprot:2982481-Alexandrium_andersonii.AAC.1